MENSLSRLKQYIDFKGINMMNFEKSVGFSNGSLAGQIKKNKTIGVDKLENILKFYTDLSASWLLTGLGNMINEENKTRSIKSVTITAEQDKVVGGIIDQIRPRLKEMEDEARHLQDTTDRVPIRYLRKMYDVLEQKHPAMYKLKIDFDRLLSFKEAIEELESSIGHDLHNAFWLYPKGKFNFDDYEKQVIEALNNIQDIAAPLNFIEEAIQNFYGQIKAVNVDLIDFESYEIS